MGYAALVKKNVRKAFNAVGDLAFSAVFTHKSDAGFDFATNLPKTQTSSSKVVKGIQVAKSRPGIGKPSSAVQTSFMFNAEDVPDPTIYDSLTITTGPATAIGVWNIVAPSSSDGFITTVNCSREA